VNRILKLYKIVRDPLFLRALLKGCAAGVEHSPVLDSLSSQRFQTVVDIGANRGQFALVARRHYPDAKIVAFEPLKEPAGIFRRVFSSDPAVVLDEIAIGPEEKTMTMHVSGQDDSSSLLTITARQSDLFPGTGEIDKRNIRVKRLDSLLEQADIAQPSMLKIDVQGFERQVLEGCRELLPCFSYVYVECSFVEMYAGQSLAHEVISYLDRAGFLLFGIHNLYYDRLGLAIQGDFLFKNRNAPV